MADRMSPSIVFMDEIDAVGTKRYDSQSGGEREIQRTMLELLNQMDGFDSGGVKVIMAAIRIESLDPLLRPVASIVRLNSRSRTSRRSVTSLTFTPAA